MNFVPEDMEQSLSLCFLHQDSKPAGQGDGFGEDVNFGCWLESADYVNLCPSIAWV